jgi:DNA-sulfur modification-associated
LNDELVAYDGETQLPAWFALLAGSGDVMRDTLIPVDVSFARSLDWARQVWHDLNVYGSRPNAALSLSMDARDPINQVADQLEKDIPFYTGQINKMKRQDKLGEGDFTLTTFRGACVTLAKGISEIAFGMKPLPGLNPEELQIIGEVANEFFTALAATIGEAIQSPKMLAKAPAVFPGRSRDRQGDDPALCRGAGRRRSTPPMLRGRSRAASHGASAGPSTRSTCTTTTAGSTTTQLP